MLPISQRTLIPINIETLAGTSFELLVSPYEQIQYIKRKIEKREGIPTSQQHLIWKSTELDDQSCLHDYQIDAGTSLKLVLGMRGGPVNTKRVPIDDSLIRDMSEYIESSREDYGMGNEFSTNKNVTFLVLRDGDQFNFFQVIDRGDGTLSPLSSSLSATSMYNTHETMTVEPERQYDEKRQADDRKTKQKMDLIRSKLKIRPRKDTIRPPSASKMNLNSYSHRNNHLDMTSKLENSSLESPVQHQRSLSYSFSANLFNTYNLLSTSTRNDLLHEEDSDDEDDDEEDDDDDSHDDDEDIKPSSSSSQPIFTSRSFSPSLFYHPTKTLMSQEAAAAAPTTTTTTTTAINDTSTSSTVLVDYIPRLSPIVPIVSSSSRLLSATKCLNTSDSPVISEEKKEILFHHSQTSPTQDEINDNTHQLKTDHSNRNDTSLTKPIWPDDNEQISLSEQQPSPKPSRVFHRQNSTTSTTAVSSVPTLPQLIRKPSLNTTTQRFYHSHSKSINTDQSSPRSLLPFTHNRRISSNVHLNNSNEIKSNTDSFNEHLMLNKRIEILKTPGKQQSPVPSPSSSININVPPPVPSKRQDIKSIPSTPATASVRPIDSTKVTIETIGPKTVSALLRQNATIEPVDTSRGVGKHLVSLLTTASRETSYKQSSRDAVIEEHYKLDSKLTNHWSNTSSIVSSSVQSNTAGIYNGNKLPPVIVNRKSTSKCFLCKKKTGLATTYQCRCGSSFCSEHRYPEAHACAFDYKAEGKRLIERNNPLITAPKLPKI